jgi:uncharacterized membrane protein
MGIGASIFLLAVGAILSFAVSDSISGVNLVIVGYILMGAGVIGLIWSLLLGVPRRRRETVVEERRLEP